MARRSAERGPTPGSLLSAAISSTIGWGKEGNGTDASHETGNAQPGGELAHLAVGDFFGLGQRLVDGREHKVFEHRNVAGVCCLRIDFDGGNGAVAAGHNFD